MHSDWFDAVKAGNVATVEELLDADPTLLGARDVDGFSAVTIATYHGRSELASALLARGPRLDVFEAAAVGDVRRLGELLDGDATLIGAWSVDGFQPLMLASFFGRIDAVRLLLDRGARHDERSRNTMSVMPLHSATAAGRTHVAELLIQRGADVNLPSHGGYTPLHAAAQNGDERLVKALLAAGSDRSARTDAGQTPAEMAADAGHADLAAALATG